MTEYYKRRLAVVEAHQLEAGNLNALALWCNGSVKGVMLPPERRCIDFSRLGEEQRAEVGDWIVKEGGLFTVYSDAAFDTLFEYAE